MDKEKVEELNVRVTSLEAALQALRADVSRLLDAHGENVATPVGAPRLKHKDHGE